MRARSLISLLLVCALALVAARGCGGPEPTQAERDADEAWEMLHDEHTDASYLYFIQKNRAAAYEHDAPFTPQGVLYQVRALEAQALEAARKPDRYLASQVVERVDELEESSQIELCEEELPGSRERLEAARERAGRLLD